MPRPPVDKRLQNIEQGISEIKDKLCEISPCEIENTENETVEEFAE